MTFISYVIRQSLLTNLLSLFIIVAGIMLLADMKREAFPAFSFDIVTVRTMYPGASPQEVEKLVTIPIEDKLRSVSELKKLDSTSIEGMSLIIIEIDPDAKNKDKVVNNIQRAVDQVDDLPDDAEDSIVDEILTGESPIIDISVGGELDEWQLRKHAKALEDRLLDLEGVSTINKNGWRDPKIVIEADPDKLAEYHLALDDVVRTVRTRSLNLPAGTIKSGTKEWLVRTAGEIEQAKLYENLIIRSDPDGNRVAIGDIGQARDAFADKTVTYKVKGKPAIILSVVKKADGDTISIVDQVNQILDEYRAGDHAGLLITTYNDQSFFIRRRLKILVTNGWVGITMVLLVLLVFLNWRIATITAVGIPIAFFLTFCTMYFLGISINLISMFGLIIVLGMIVDDAIIIAENGYRYLEEGMPPSRAAVVGTAEVARPVTVTILTTIASFLPLMLMSGIFGKFLKQIPMVVIIALTASLLEAFFVLPAHIVDFAKAKAASPSRQTFTRLFDRFREKYVRFLAKALANRYLVVGIFSIALALSITLATKKMKFVLFPAEGIEIFFVRAAMPRDTPIEATEEAIKPIEQLIGALPDEELDNFVTVAGIHEQDPTDPLTKRGSHLAQIVVYLTPPQTRARDATTIINGIKSKTDSLKQFDYISFDRVRPGPPVGKPVAIKIKGDDLKLMDSVAEELKEQLKSIAGVVSTDDDYELGKTELKVIVDEAKTKRASLDLASIATAVRTVFNGETARTIKTTDDEINVVVRFAEKYRNSQNALDKLVIRNPQNRLIPFSKVASLKEEQGVNAIKHRDTKRVITVVAEIDESVTSAVGVNRMLNDKIAEIHDKHPQLSLTQGGEFEDTQESLASLNRAFILAAILIFIILTTLFRSVFRPLIVMAAIPLGFIGVVIAFFFHGLPLSFMGLLGVIGLSGVVVNDSIVLVDFNQQLRKKGMQGHASLIEAGKKRVRPVLLTTFTTIVGLLPVAYGLGGSDPFLKPAALSICWGLMFATVIILIVVPCLYAIQDDIKEIFS